MLISMFFIQHKQNLEFLEQNPIKDARDVWKGFLLIIYKFDIRLANDSPMTFNMNSTRNQV